MLSWEEDVQAHALRRQGWTISAIARHLGRDRKTIQAYLRGERTPGVRVRRSPDPFEPFADYCRLRLEGDPHLWATTLFDEVGELGYPGAYPSFTRALRSGRLRPHCELCRQSVGRDHAVIEHPPGHETQWDWLELPTRPSAGAGTARRTCWSVRWPAPAVAWGAAGSRGPGAPGRRAGSGGPPAGWADQTLAV